jgi:glycogen(starch) synthase
MIRVLMTADTVCGVWTYALELARALAPADVEVHVATMGRRPTPEQRAQAKEVFASLEESEFALEWQPDPWPEVDRAGAWLLGLAAQVAPHVVHLNGYAHAALAWPAPVVVVAHSCVLSWWEAVRDEPAPPEWDEYGRRVAAGLAAADAVVAPTQAVLEDLHRHYRLGGGFVVPNCRAAVELQRETSKEPFVLGAGRVWDEAKNLHRLLAVAPRLPWPVQVAGDPVPPHSPQVAPSANTTMLGRLPWPELADRLRRAAIYAAPASYEPFGLGALEAAQAGCALVLGDIPSLREVWGGAARYVPPRADDGLCSALEELCLDPELREELAHSARRRAARYTPEATARGYLRVLTDLLGGELASA